MFNSDKFEPKEKTLHISWFLEIIINGIRSKNDWDILKDMDLFNIILIIFNFGNSKNRVIFEKITHSVAFLFIMLYYFCIRNWY